MEKERIESLLDKVLLATRKNKIDWEKNPKSESAYKAELAYNTIHILGVSNNYTFVIINESGDEIGRLNGFAYDIKLQELYKLARIRALRINENLDEIDSFLDGLI